MSLVADTQPRGDDYDGDAVHVAVLPRQSWTIDVLVLTAIALTAIATAFALQGEVGLTTAPSMLLGIVAFIALASIHMAMRRMEYRGRVAAAIREVAVTDAHSPNATGPAMAAYAPPRSSERSMPPASSTRSDPLDAPTAEKAKHDVSPASVTPAGPKAATPIATAEGAKADPWSVRPGHERAPASVAQVSTGHGPSLGAGPVPNPSSPKAAEEQDPRMIEQVLARMARDLAAAPPSYGTPAGEALSGTAPQANHQSEAGGDALPAVSTLEREPRPSGSAPPPLPKKTVGDEPAPKAAAQDQLAAIAGALAQERIDVFLEPIAGLEGEGVAHFEVAVRLRLDGGVSQERSAYGEAAAGTPLLPLIDTLALAKGRRVAWRVFRPDEAGRVFTAVDAGSLTDGQFLADFETMVRGDATGAKRLVMSFGHSEARALTPAQTATLSRLSASGFAFAIDDLVDMDMDFGALSKAGFSFVKVDADVFLDGMPVSQSWIPADDICRHLKSFGLQPIVGHIADRSQLQRLRACGVALGQGPLLGGAHIVQSEWLDD